jgi:SAM-dependent methyltransferase
VDLGTGNGRDALWFARNGRDVYAVDYSAGVLGRASRRPGFRKLPVTFATTNLNDTREVLALGTKLARADDTVDLYGRFLLHSLAEPGRDNLYRLASMSLRRGGRLFLEFRTTQDASRSHHFTTGNRHYLDPAEVVGHIEARGGTVLHVSSGTGLARFEDEDPHVARVVATWNDGPSHP